MSINVQCPNCQKKLQAKDSLAGKAVKCPVCGTEVVLPVTHEIPLENTGSSVPLVQAIAGGDLEEIVALLRDQEFTIVEAADDEGSEGKSAMMAEVDGFPALVAFTSQELAAHFAAAVPGMLDDDGAMAAFVVSGADLLAPLGDGHGVLLNPETEDAAVLVPEMVDELKRLL